MVTDGNAMIASIVSQTASPRFMYRSRHQTAPLQHAYVELYRDQTQTIGYSMAEARPTRSFVFVCDKKSDWKVVVMLEVQGKVDGGW